MPHLPKLARMRSTGVILLKHPCYVCGQEWAPYGVGVVLTKAVKVLAEGGEPLRYLGKWFCGPDGCRKASKGGDADEAVTPGGPAVGGAPAQDSRQGVLL